MQRINSEGQNNETYLYDGHDSVVGAVDNSYEFVSYSYTAYGDLMPNSQEPNTFGFNGEQIDFSNGIQYLRARYYDTNINRFFQEDDYKGDYTRPSSMNRYVYVEGNPVSRIDPSGYFYYNGSGQQATPIKIEPKSVGNQVSNFYTDYYTKKANTPTIIHNTAEYYQHMYGKQNQPTIINYNGKVMIKNPYLYGPNWVSEAAYNCMKDLENGKEIDLGKYADAVPELENIIEDALEYNNQQRLSSEDYDVRNSSAKLYSDYLHLYSQWDDYYKNIEKYNQIVEIHNDLVEESMVYYNGENQPSGVYYDDTTLSIPIISLGPYVGVSLDLGSTKLYNINTKQVSKYTHWGLSPGVSLPIPTIQKSLGNVTDNVDDPNDYAGGFLQWAIAPGFGLTEAYGVDENGFTGVNQSGGLVQSNASANAGISWYSRLYTQTIND